MKRKHQAFRHTVSSSALLALGFLLNACGGVQSSDGSSKDNATYLAAINAARAQARDCGDAHFQAAPKLAWNAKLAAAAQEHSDDMARNNLTGHEGSDGSTPKERIENQGYQYHSLSENVAAGQSDTNEVVQAWLDSPVHCENIMDPKFTEMGMALSENNTSDYRQYWTLDLGSR